MYISLYHTTIISALRRETNEQRTSSCVSFFLFCAVLSQRTLGSSLYNAVLVCIKMLCNLYNTKYYHTALTAVCMIQTSSTTTRPCGGGQGGHHYSQVPCACAYNAGSSPDRPGILPSHTSSPHPSLLDDLLDHDDISFKHSSFMLHTHHQQQSPFILTVFCIFLIFQIKTEQKHGTIFTEFLCAGTIWLSLCVLLLLPFAVCLWWIWWYATESWKNEKCKMCAFSVLASFARQHLISSFFGSQFSVVIYCRCCDSKTRLNAACGIDYHTYSKQQQRKS